MNDTYRVRHVDLFRSESAVAHRVPRRDLELVMSRETYEDAVWNDLEYRLRTYVAAQTVDSYSFRAPLTWWDAVLERFAPAWVLKRRPVRYRTQRVEVRAEYPGITIPDREHRLRVYVDDQPLLRKTA